MKIHVRTLQQLEPKVRLSNERYEEIKQTVVKMFEQKTTSLLNPYV